MCNLYNITTDQEATRAIMRAMIANLRSLQRGCLWRSTQVFSDLTGVRTLIFKSELQRLKVAPDTVNFSEFKDLNRRWRSL